MTRQLIPSGSPLEQQIGFSRAVRVGNFVAIAGTAPIPPDGSPPPETVYAQTELCLSIALRAAAEAGAQAEDAVRTRIFLTDISEWEEAARAHGAHFSTIRPACTFMEISRFIDARWRVEVELDAIIKEDIS